MMQFTAEEKQAQYWVAGLLLGSILFARWHKCNRACPTAIDEMITGTGTYKNLAQLFGRLGMCAPCVKYAQKQLPTILLAAPQHAVVNTLEMRVALRFSGLTETI